MIYVFAVIFKTKTRSGTLYKVFKMEKNGWRDKGMPFFGTYLILGEFYVSH
jgi:hypothetical protein